MTRLKPLYGRHQFVFIQLRIVGNPPRGEISGSHQEANQSRYAGIVIAWFHGLLCGL
jgi:hypothetical protein